MPIPKHNEIRIPVLEVLKKNGASGSKQLLEPLAKHFHLSDAEVNQLYESGKGFIFRSRISWALSYLKMAGLVESVVRGSVYILISNPKI